MKIVLTGATGFVGKAVLADLAIQGYEIIGLTRRRENLANLPCQAVECDMSKSNSGKLAEVLKGADVIIHLAGEPVAAAKWTDATKKRIRSSRIESTRSIVDALGFLPKDLRPKTFICASAIGLYGNRGDEWLSEESPPGEGFLSEVVRDWEDQARKADALGIRTVLLRIGIVLGRNGGALEKMVPVTLGSGQQWMSWIHLEDLVRFVRHAIQNSEVVGPYHLVAPNPVRNKEFTQELGRSQNLPAVMGAPAFALRAVLGEMASIVLDSARVSSEKIQKSGFQFRFGTLAEALADLKGGLRGHERRFSAMQFVPKPIDQVFDFFSQAENLEKITPPWLGFQITGKSTPQIQNHTLIDYKLKIHGVPVRWKTRIEDWSPNSQFVDTQLAGPYKKWHHTHRFFPVPGGTLMTDEVVYELPVGILGSWVAGAWVRNDVKKIFQYRTQVIARTFQPE